KLAPGNPVGITIVTSVYPTIELPKNWKKLGEGVEVETVADILDAEIDEALTSIRRARAKADDAGSSVADGGALQRDGAKPEQIPSKESAYPESADAAGGKLAEPQNLPELNDEFAQSLGGFTDLADLKQKLKDNIKSEKEQQAKDKRRGKII